MIWVAAELIGSMADRYNTHCSPHLHHSWIASGNISTKHLSIMKIKGHAEYAHANIHRLMTTGHNVILANLNIWSTLSVTESQN